MSIVRSIPRSLAATLVGLTASLATAQELVRYDAHQVVRAEVDTLRELRTLLALGGDVWSESIGLGSIDVMLPVDRIGTLTRTGIEFEVMIPDVQRLIDEERSRIDADGIAGVGFFEEYHQQDELFAFYEALEESRPDLVTSRSIGESIEGREIRAYTISGAADPSSVPGIYIVAGAHAREWISPATISYLADTLVNGHGADDRITPLVDDLAWHIVPLANPDGYQFTWDSNRLWRKTRKANGDGTFGVDWNRNFAAGWGGPGSSGNTGSDTYRGTGPFSEPETQAIRDDVAANPNTSIFFDVHCYSQLVLWPYGYDSTEPEGPAGEIHRNLGEGIAEAIESINGRIFAPQPAHDLYLASGTSLDWAWDDAGVYAFTYELRDTGEFGFVLPPDQIIPSGDEILESFLYVGEELVGSSALVEFPDGFPTVVEPDTNTDLIVSILSVFNELDPTSAMVRTRVDDGPLVTESMSLAGIGRYLATIPAASCGAVIEVEFMIETTSGNTIVLQSETGPWTIDVADEEIFFADDAEADLGWTLGLPGDDATTGVWVRVDPNGTAAQPEDDASDPGTRCFVTGQGSLGGGLGENDVDGGSTSLVTPSIDTTGADVGTVAFAYWYRNDAGASPNQDSMPVEISTDEGSSWTTIATISDNAAAWRLLEIEVDLSGSTTTLVRFVASDLGDGSIVEAAIDDFSLTTRSCPKIDCPGDLNGGGQVDGGDLGLLLAAWGTSDPSADLNGDGTVNGADLGLLLAAWGPCP